jgi:hypothetical protein
MERPDNPLRWGLTVEPDMSGGKSATIAYQFKPECARDVAIADLKAKLWSKQADAEAIGRPGGLRSHTSGLERPGLATLRFES